MASAIARDLRLECDLQQVDHFPASRFDVDCIDAVRAATRGLGYPYREMVSGAGHDAIYIARVAPTSMIFVALQRWHQPQRHRGCRPEHLEAGANVLPHAMLARAGV
jgi:N-carbamoyl-L-amino-acid hydrolase